MATGAISLELKQPENEANHPPPSSVDVENGGNVRGIFEKQRYKASKSAK
jgi:hypothetical protein